MGNGSGPNAITGAIGVEAVGEQLGGACFAIRLEEIGVDVAEENVLLVRQPGEEAIKAVVREGGIGLIRLITGEKRKKGDFAPLGKLDGASGG